MLVLLRLSTCFDCVGLLSHRVFALQYTRIQINAVTIALTRNPVCVAEDEHMLALTVPVLRDCSYLLCDNKSSCGSEAVTNGKLRKVCYIAQHVLASTVPVLCRSAYLLCSIQQRSVEVPMHSCFDVQVLLSTCLL